MNIQRAKQEIARTLRAYLEKDELGRYRIPPLRQRPLLLMGPPGVGKTQIMEQVARECGVGLVSYTITHHTRQSAVGLPMIASRTWDGAEHTITEYTMSEIIASVYQCMEDTGLREGILFIDEINCVSETLAPTMLQFLQGKTFGNQPVPQGWVIAAAGNPPEYNKSVREFDVVTLDRVRRLDIQPDLAVWKTYARENGVHSAILSYLELRPEHFYKVTQDVDGLQFVTARGWEDLSQMLLACERLGETADEELVAQYLQHPQIAADFAAYFDLYLKYGNDYGVEEILAGHPSPEVWQRAQAAGFDERLSLVGLLLSGMAVRFNTAMRADETAADCFAIVNSWRQEEGDPAARFARVLQLRANELEARRKARLLSRTDEARAARTAKAVAELEAAVQAAPDTEEDVLAALRMAFAPVREARQNAAAIVLQSLEAAFDFLEQAFGSGQEMLVFVTELGLAGDSAAFLQQNDCPRYYKYSEELLLNGRTARILREIAADRERS